MNRWIGAALALALAACVLAPPGLVFAEDAPQAAASEAVLDLDEHGEAGAEASITGTVRANLVSATLPSNIAFTFDPADVEEIEVLCEEVKLEPTFPPPKKKKKRKRRRK